MEHTAYSATAGTPDNSGCVDLADTSSLLDLNLPAGAQVTQVRARYFDTSTDKDMQLGLEVATPTGHTIVAAGGSSNSPTLKLAALAGDPGTVLPPVSDNTTYYMFANPGGTHNGVLAFCGAAVDYKLSG